VSRGERWILVGCLIVALALRLTGLSYTDDTRATYHEDTPKQIARVADFLAGRLIPPEDTYPTLHMYVVALVLKALIVLDPHAWGRGPSELQVAVTARVVNALLGTLTVVVIYLAGRWLFGAPVGHLAALLAAVSSLAILHAHYESGDTAHTFFVAASFAAAVRVGLGGGLRWFVLAGLAAGLAASAKYYGGSVLAVLLIAAWIGGRDQDWGRLLVRLAAAAAASGLAFVLTTPKLLVTPREFVAQYGEGFVPLMPPPPPLERPLVAAKALFGVALEWFGPLFVALVVLGLIWLVRSRRRVDLLPLALPPLVFAIYVLTRPHRLDDRNLVIFLPFLLLMVSVALVRLGEGRGWRRGAAFTLGLILVGSAAVDAVYVAYAFWQDDTRMFASRWLRHRVPAAATIRGAEYHDSVEAYQATGAELLRLDSRKWRWDVAWYTPRPQETTRRALAVLEARGKLLGRFELLPRAFTAPTLAFYDLTSMAIPHAFPPPEGAARFTDALIFLDEDAVPDRVGILVERDHTTHHTLVSRRPLGELSLAVSGIGHVRVRQGNRRMAVAVDPGAPRVVTFTPRASFPWFKYFYPLTVQARDGHVYVRVLLTPCEHADLLLAHQRWDEAVPLLERCRDRRWDAPARLLDLAWAEAARGRPDRARAALDGLRRHDPDLLRGLLDLARAEDSDAWRERYRRLAGHPSWFWWDHTVTFQAEDARQRVGRVVERDGAAGGRIVLAEPGRAEPGYLKIWFPQHFLRGAYLVRFRLRGTPAGAGSLAVLSVVRHFQNAVVDVSAGQPWAGGGPDFRDVVLRVSLDREPMGLEARVFYAGGGTLEIDEVAVLPDVRTSLRAKFTALTPLLGDLVADGVRRP
jgi:4-amino-4-deoxy-L-arabinose transferase-like glycosyltransferase